MKYFFSLVLFLLFASPIYADGAKLNLTVPAQVKSGQALTVQTSLGSLPASGIIGLRLVYRFDSAQLKPDSIEMQLPDSWTVIHKQIDPKQIIIEAAYLHPGVTGFTSSANVPLAALHFKTGYYGHAHVILDTAQSQILAKSGNQNILAQTSPDQIVYVAPSGFWQIFNSLLGWIKGKKV